MNHDAGERAHPAAADAWALAHRSAEASGVALRSFRSLEDADRILRVMEATWGGLEPFPREMIQALADSGNVPILAFEGEEAVGYVLGWTGVEPEDGIHVHSHMLAALPDRRHKGVGFALKLAQRAQALEQGVEVVRWTFDPLIARNAYFNLHKLGVVADRFDRNHYGEMSDEMNAGERSDRFTVRWDLERQPGPRPVAAADVVLGRSGDAPGAARAPVGRAALVAIPREYAELRTADPSLASAWREASAAAIEACLAAGMVAAGIRRDRLPVRVRRPGGPAAVTRVRAIELRLVAIPLVRPFRTSFGESTDKVCILARVETDDAAGWGECVADVEPNFSEEWNDGAWLLIRDLLAPALLATKDLAPEDVERTFSFVRGHPMAKATLVNAVIDADLRAQGRSLASMLGATRDRVECGVSVGIAASAVELLEQVDGYLAEGYRRIKLKIEPGTDVERVRAVREAHPDIALSVDANAAYTLDDVDVFRALDGFRLLMIEQPLHHDDLWDHAELQRRIATDLCLDESIRSAADARAAIELGACRIVNVKQGRVGGLLEARRVHDVAAERSIPVWCGGMLETGIGRATNLALAAMPNFRLPGDTSASRRYFHEDLTEPFELGADGTMAVPAGPGIGVEPDPALLESFTVRSERLEKE